MNKVKSAICLTLITILIAGVIFMCSAMFTHGQAGASRYNNIVSMTDKDAQYGGLTFDDDGTDFAEGKAEDKENYYRGGGFVAVYYPAGVLSESEYAANLAAYENNDEQREEYEKQYGNRVGSLYFESDLVEKATDGTFTPTEDFLADFDNAVSQLKTRIERLEMANARVDLINEYAVRVYLPSVRARQDNSELLTVFNSVRRIGEFTVSAGSSETDATPISYGKKEVNGVYEDETISDYVSGVSPYIVGSAAVVNVDFTDKGQQWLQEHTAEAASTAVTLVFKIGEETVASVSTSETITSRTVQFGKSGGSTMTAFSPFEARAVAASLNTAIRNADNSLSFTVGDFTFEKAQFGDLALTLLYIAFAVLFVGMMVFFFVRYHGLAIAHLYSFLIYVLPMIVLVWAIPFLNLSVWTVVAIALGGLLLSVCNVISYESARKEFALGKTIASSVKTGYKKCFWLIFDLHIAVALFGFVTYFIALTQLSVFAFTLGLAAVLSGLCSLAVNRFHWAMLMTFTKKPGDFCNFKREEVADDE